MESGSVNKIELACEGCGKVHDVTERRPGKRIRCTDCHKIMTVPTPAAEEEKGRYDAQRKILFCNGCSRPIDLQACEPGVRMACPDCHTPFVVPDAHEPVRAAPAASQGNQQFYDAQKRTLTCHNCSAEYVVERYRPGREILCLGCEVILVVPSDHVQRGQTEVVPEYVPRQSPEPQAEPPPAPHVQTSTPTMDELLSNLPQVAEGGKTITKTRAPVVAPAPQPQQRQNLPCGGCGHLLDVTGYDPGRDVMCPKCEQSMKVPKVVPVTTDVTGLATLDLHADALSAEAEPFDPNAARKTFSAFYDEIEQKAIEAAEAAEEEDPRKATRPTMRVATSEFDEILEPSVQRQSLHKAALHAKSITAKESVEVKHFPILRTTVLTILVLSVALFGYLYIKSIRMQAEQRDLIAEREKAKAKPLRPVQAVGEFAPGTRVELCGVVRGGQGNLLAAERFGFMMITRGGGDVWVEDTSRARKTMFAEMAERHAGRQRITLRLMGTIRPMSKLGREGLPVAIKKHKYWVEADAATFEYGSYRQFMQLQNSITVVKK